jgi:hypothetical protein
MELSHMSGDKKDWIGIYPVGSSNEWKNVVSWEWTNGKGVNDEEISLSKISKVGNYEARAFFRNSYELEGKSQAFEVTLSSGGETELSVKQYHVENYSNSIFLSFKNMGHNPTDWIGLYPINSNNEWKNVKAWRWIKNMENNSVLLDFPKNIASGEYEIRAFFNNSFEVEAKSNPIFITSNSEIEITTSQTKYSKNEPIKVNFKDDSNKEKNWIGIYKAGTQTLFENNLAWQWTENKKEGQLIFNDLPVGEYDVRAFFSNSYKIEALISFEVTDDVQIDFPKSVLNGKENPESGVYVKYYQDKAYISITDRSVYADKHQGITLVDYSNPENPTIITYNPNFYWGRFSHSAELTKEGSIITFIDQKWKLATLTADNLTLLDNHILIYYADYQPTITRVEGYNLFYTSQSWAERRKYRYYYINLDGEVTFVDFNASIGLDNNYVTNKGLLDGNRYFITHRKKNIEDEWELHKLIYDISNLPNITLLETIIL